MRFPSAICSAYLLLPQCILGLVLLAPPDGQYLDDGDIERVDLDNILTQLPWNIPMSNLERRILALDDEDGTLTRDLLTTTVKSPQKNFKSRPRPSHRDQTRQNKSDLYSEVGHSLARDGDSSAARPPGSQVSRSETIPDAPRGTQVSHLVDTISQTLRRRLLLQGGVSPTVLPPSLAASSSTKERDSGHGILQKTSQLPQEDGESLSQKELFFNTTQDYEVEKSVLPTVSRRSKRWAPIKIAHQIKAGVAPARPIITRKRQRVNAKVGVLVVVDNSIYRQYLGDNGGDPKVALARIRRYYGMVFAMIDQRYATISDPNLSISVKISGILVAEKRQDSGWLEQIVDWKTVATHGMASVYTDRALKKFTKWLGGRRHLPDFDHAMVFTSYRLTVKQGISLGGMAYLNAICQTSSSVSIVADRGDFQCVKVATHELAHSLGANHDGDKQSKSCPPSGNYVMSPQPSHEKHVLKNAFYFSPCSIRDMTFHLSKFQSTCVKNDPPVYYSYDLKRLPPGHLYTADMQCKLIFGKQSSFCTEVNVRDVMCGQLWCKDPLKQTGCRTNSYLTALPGTECGTNKICHLGECILDPAKNAINSPQPRIRIIPNSQRQKDVPSFRMRRPATTTTTRRADEKRVRSSTHQERCKSDVNQEYCAGLLQVNPGGCQRRTIRQYCCNTCQRLGNN